MIYMFYTVKNLPLQSAPVERYRAPRWIAGDEQPCLNPFVLVSKWKQPRLRDKFSHCVFGLHFRQRQLCLSDEKYIPVNRLGHHIDFHLPAINAYPPPPGSIAKPSGVVEGVDLVLRAEGVAVPKKARYLYNRPWNGNVFAKSGLPLGPFAVGD